MSRSGKHAQGPWDVCGECREASGEAGVHVLCALHGAAPALLEALKEIVKCVESPDSKDDPWDLPKDTFLKARAAIAAAEEGRICSCEGDGHEDGCVVVERR